MKVIRKNRNYFNTSLDKAALPNAPASKDEARSRWTSFNKDTLFRDLFREQFGLCAYTEVNILDFQKEHDSLKGAHIEHMKPKSIFPQETFDYNNLVLSALDSQDLNLFGKDSRFGGHHKLSVYDENKFISPMDINLESIFSFSSEDGEIFPRYGLTKAEESKAKYTIELLNLNCMYLKNNRKNWLNELQVEIDKLIDIDSKEGLENLAECELCPSDRAFEPINQTLPQLRNFHSASLQLFGELGKQLLISKSPECL